MLIIKLSFVESSTAICMKCCPLVTLFQVLKFISSTWPKRAHDWVPTMTMSTLPKGAGNGAVCQCRCQVRLLWALVRLMLFAASRNVSLQPGPQRRCSCVRHAVLCKKVQMRAEEQRSCWLSLRRIWISELHIQNFIWKSTFSVYEFLKKLTVTVVAVTFGAVFAAIAAAAVVFLLIVLTAFGSGFWVLGSCKCQFLVAICKCIQLLARTAPSGMIFNISKDCRVNVGLGAA